MQSIIKGIMLKHGDGDLEYYEPKLTDEDISAIYKILEKYGDSNDSVRGTLKVIDLDD